MNAFRLTLVIITLLSAVLLVVPLIMLVVQSLSAKPALWPESFTLKWYKMQANTIIPSVLTSLSIAFPATLCATFISLPLGRVLARHEFYGKKSIQGLITLPIVIPGVTLGLAYLQLANTGFLREVPPLLMIIIVHVVLIFPYISRAVIAGYKALDITLEEASATLGANPRHTFANVIFPLLMPFILAGGILGFSRSMN
ncbi:MAG: ABC transporter permease subunit, partial [Candidatus Methanomethyliaceae archaeon]